MADRLELGIRVDLSGNVEQAAARATKALQETASATQSLSHNARTGQNNILALQSSLFVLVKASESMRDVGVSVLKTFGNALLGGIKLSSELEQSLGFLRVAAGKDFEFAAESVKKLARETNLSMTEAVDISQRLLSVGLTMGQVFGRAAKTTNTGLETVAATIARLSGMDRVRAINGIANAFQSLDSAAMLFNTSATQAEKLNFSSARKELDKFNFTLQFLDKRFKGVFGEQGIGGSLMFNAQRAFQNLIFLIQESFTPLIKALTPHFINLNKQFEGLLKNQKFMKNLMNIVMFFGKIALSAMELLSLSIQKVVELIEKRPGELKFIGTLVLFTGTLMAVVGAVAFFGFSLTLVSISLSKFFGIAAPIILGFSSIVKVLSVSIGGWLVAAGSFITKIASIGLALSSLGLIIAAGLSLPDIFSLWGKGAKIFGITLGTIVDFLIIITSLIAGLVSGFATANPLIGLAVGSGTFAAMTQFKKGLIGSVNPTADTQQSAVSNLPADTQGITAMQESQKRQEEILSRLVANSENRPIDINNQVILDGRVISDSVFKVRKEQESRFNLNKRVMP